MRISMLLGNAGQNSGGMEVYEMELLRGLMRVDRKNEYHVQFLWPDGPEKVGTPPDNFHFEVVSPSNRVVSLTTTLPVTVRKLGADVHHSTFVPHLFIRPKSVYTLPCSAVFARPEFYPLPIRIRLKLLVGYGVRKSDMVVCMSHHAKDYLRDHLGIEEERLAVTHLSANATFRRVPAEEANLIVRDKYQIDYPYFIYSGRWEERKNITRVIQAFAQFKREDKSGVKLVMTGTRTWAGDRILKLIQSLGIGNYVVDIGKSPLSELPALYGQSIALVFPSMWESFGLPIVEAMKCGTPVITSNVSCMPEIAGGAALLVDPFRQEDIAQAMHQLSTDRALCARLRETGLERAEFFSWDNTARKSLEVYERLASRS